MNQVFVLLTSLLLRLSSPLGTAHHPAPGAVRETAAPAVDSVAAAAAARHAAYLADVLHLSREQVLHLRRAAIIRQQDLDAAETAAPGQTAAQAGEVRYQQYLVRVLSASQYSALLVLDDTPVALLHHRSLRQANRYWARPAFQPCGQQPALLATTSQSPTPAVR